MSTSDDRRPVLARSAEAREDHGSGAVINLRNRQQYLLNGADSDDVLLVLEGCFVLALGLPGDRRQVMLVLYPGDALPCRGIPAGNVWELTAMMPSRLQRLGRGSLDVRAIDRLVARAMLYAGVVGHLSVEERVATLLMDLVQHLGRKVPGGWSFDMPLTRADIADHLAINPDTLSRLMSRLRASEIVRMPTRRRVVVRDLERLRALTPLSDAIASLPHVPVMPSAA
jgi:CRP/FNR family transcriptional regulator